LSNTKNRDSEPILVDTHCHLDFEQFDLDRDAVINRAAEVGVKQIIIPAIDLRSCRKVLALADQYDSIFAAIGVHPNSSAGWQDEWIEQIKEMAQHPKVVAIGEIGLDYYRNHSPNSVQRHALNAQLHLATELDLPVIIHNRQADEDVLSMLADHTTVRGDRPGVLHSFLTNWESAEMALDLGFFLGFTGPVTYKKSVELREVVSRVPHDRVLVETDAPFLTPQLYRGKRNEPAYVKIVVDQIATIWGDPYEQVATQTTTNAIHLFGNQLLIRHQSE
jgi:TatD DNase family protein